MSHKKKKRREHKHKEPRHKRSLRVVSYGCVIGISASILTYICRGMIEPHETIKFVELATVAMSVIDEFA